MKKYLLFPGFFFFAQLFSADLQVLPILVDYDRKDLGVLSYYLADTSPSQYRLTVGDAYYLIINERVNAALAHINSARELALLHAMREVTRDEYKIRLKDQSSKKSS